MVNTGYKQSLYFGNETSYGSTAVISQPIGLVQSVNPTETNNLIKIRTLGGDRDYSNVVPGKFEISGTFDYYLQTANFFRMAMGEDTATTTTVDSGPVYHTGQGGVGTAYCHVMGSAASPLANSFPSFSLEFADDEDGGSPGTYNLLRTYSGARVNSLSMNASVDEPVSISVDWMAQNVTISTAGNTSVTESTKDPYVFYQGAVFATSASVGRYTTQASLTSDSICEVNGFDWSVNNNLEAVWYVSGTCNSFETNRGARLIIPKGRDYESNLNLHFANKTQYERFLGAAAATGPQDTLTEYDIVLDFVRSGTIGGTKAVTDDWIRIVMKDAKFDSINIPGGPEDIISQTISLALESAVVYAVDNDESYE